MKKRDGYKLVRYVSIVGRNRACVIDWYGNRVTKEMPLAFAKAYVDRHSSNGLDKPY